MEKGERVVTFNQGLLVSSEIKDFDVIVVTSKDEETRWLVWDLRQQMRSLTYTESPVEAHQWVDARNGRKIIMLVDVDVFERYGDAVEWLLVLRKVFSELTIIMMSSRFSRNDFSNERKAISDCSLRLPTSPAILAMSLDVARTNTRSRSG